MRPLVASAALVALTALAQPAGALAAQRWASAASTVTSGPCPATAPCRIDAALNEAAARDEIILEPGTYGVLTPLDPPAQVDVHGVAGRARPWLVAEPGLTGVLMYVKQRGTLEHVGIDTSSADQPGLQVQGGTAADVLVLSGDADAVHLVASPNASVLSSSVVHTDTSDGGVAAVRVTGSELPVEARMVGVTVAAPGTTAVSCEPTTGSATFVDTIARGSSRDIDAHDAAPGSCTAQASDFRTAASPGVVDGGGNIALDPLFLDVSGSDYREAVGSPTIDAGITDPLLGAFDPAGCPRPIGAAPDMGAYEQPGVGDACASAAPEPLAPHVPPVIAGDPPVTGHGHSGDDDQGDDEEGASPASGPPPVIGRRVVLAPARGHIRFRVPGSKRFRALDAGVRVPVGSVIDATNGRVSLTSAIDAAGTVQTGTFWGSRFAVQQGRRGRGMTTLVLRGGSFRRICGLRAARASAASAPLAVAARRRHRRVRSLWARDRHGRFRTHGANSVATARGTAWVTQDRCDGTRTRVTRGAVAVRDLARHRTVLVRAGHAYLARKHR